MGSLHEFLSHYNTNLLRDEFAAAGYDVVVTLITNDEIEIEGNHTQEQGDAIVANHTGGDSPQIAAAIEREVALSEAIDVLRQWAQEADAVTVTSANAIPTLQVVVDRLGIFFEHFANLLENQSVERSIQQGDIHG